MQRIAYIPRDAVRRDPDAPGQNSFFPRVIGFMASLFNWACVDTLLRWLPSYKYLPFPGTVFAMPPGIIHIHAAAARYDIATFGGFHRFLGRVAKHDVRDVC